jgi:YbgC/YbaW family acyl-CoA thioester hydrolase
MEGGSVVGKVGRTRGYLARMTASPTASAAGAAGAAAEIPAVAFEVAERVRWEDVDLVGIVRYSAYTRLMDVAEAELCRAAGLAHPVAVERYGVWLVRRVLHLEYHAPARFDALLRLRVWVGRVGRTSLTLHVVVLDETGTTRHAAGHFVLVAVPTDGFEAIAVPAGIVEALGPYRAG